MKQVKLDKTRKLQGLGRPGGQAMASSGNAELDDLMLRNGTDVRELPSMYEGSPTDPYGRHGDAPSGELSHGAPDVGEAGSNQKRYSQQ